MVRLAPYLSFRDQARTAMQFYRSVFGGELTLSPFASFDVGQNPDEADLIMHAQLETPHGLTLMASDTPRHLPYRAPAGVSLSLDGGDDDAARLEEWWGALADGGRITIPLETPPWGGRFGMLTDRFGVDWMVSIST